MGADLPSTAGGLAQAVSEADEVTAPSRIACRRQPKSCDGEMPISRAAAEIFTSESSVAATARALNSSDQRRRRETGAPSRRSTTASISWKLLSPDIGANMDAHSRRNCAATDSRPTYSPPSWDGLGAYVGTLPLQIAFYHAAKGFICCCCCGHVVNASALSIMSALRVLRAIRPKYACRGCEEAVVQAPRAATSDRKRNGLDRTRGLCCRGEIRLGLDALSSGADPRRPRRLHRSSVAGPADEMDGLDADRLRTPEVRGF
jgi:hypothetical protein